MNKPAIYGARLCMDKVAVYDSEVIVNKLERPEPWIPKPMFLNPGQMNRTPGTVSDQNPRLATNKSSNPNPQTLDSLDRHPGTVGDRSSILVSDRDILHFETSVRFTLPWVQNFLCTPDVLEGRQALPVVLRGTRACSCCRGFGV